MNKRTSNGKKQLYRVLCLAMALCLVFGMLPVAAAASSSVQDALLTIVVQSMNLSSGDKTTVANAITNQDAAGTALNKSVSERRLMIEGVFADSATFNSADIEAALVEVDKHPTRKATIRLLITGSTPTLVYSRTNFSSSSPINKEINDLLGIAGTDENGLKFIVKLLNTVKDFNTGLGDNTSIAGDATNVNQIKFNLGTFGEAAAPIFNDLIGSFQTLSQKLGQNANFDGLIAYLTNKVNVQSNADIKAFKQFLIANGNLYKGSVALNPLDNDGGSTTTTTPPPPPANNTNDQIDKSAEEVNNALKSTTITDTKAVVEALTNAAAALTGTNETTTTTNITKLTNDILAHANELVTKTTTEAQKQEVINSVVALINSAAAAAESITTKENAVAMASSFGTMLTQAKAMSTSATGTTEQKLTEAIETIENAMAQIANQVIDKASSKTVAAAVTGTTANVTLDTQAVADLLAKAAEVSTVAATLEKAMTDNGIEKNLKTKVTLEVTGTAAATDIKAELPSNLLTQVEAKGIDSIQIAAGIATISVAPDFIKDAATAQSTSLEVKKLAVTSDLTSKMTEAQKKLLDNSTVIFDFNAATKDAAGVESKVSKFDSKVTIELPYTLKAGENKNHITILYLADDGTIKNMAGKYDEKSGMVVFETNHFSKYIVKQNVVKFSDVAGAFWASQEIEAMAAKGVINGDGSGKYLPGNNITRAEFAKLITTALNIVDETATTTLKDVKEGAWYYAYVASASKAGIISGNAEGNFAPNATITRQDMATMLSRALIFVQGEAKASNTALFLGSFTDKAKIASYAVDGAATSIKFGLMNGKPGNQFDPAGKVTKAEAATVIYRLFNK